MGIIESIKETIPSSYSEEEKEKISILLIDLANIYLNTREV